MAKITAALVALVAILASAFVPFSKADICSPIQIALGYKPAGWDNGYSAMYANNCGIIKKAAGFCGYHEFEPSKGYDDFPFGKVDCDNKSKPTKVTAPDKSVFYPCHEQPKNAVRCGGDHIVYCCDRARILFDR